MKTLGIGKPGFKTISVWAEDKGLDKDGALHFHCLNGSWNGKIAANGMLMVENHDRWDDCYLAAVLWKGDVPHPHGRHYNPAMAWIEQELAEGHHGEA